MANTMNKNDVIAGRRFHHRVDFHVCEYSFKKTLGRYLTLVRYNSHQVGQVTAIEEESFTVTIWLFNQEVSVKIPYTELTIIEPKNNY